MNDTVIFAGKRTVVIIPTFNERDNIERVISAMDEATGGACDILFVDDNSPDGTGALIEDIRKRKPNVYAIHRAGKMGLGSAYIDGFRYAVRNGYEYMIEMDADLSHDPAYLPQMMRALESDDIVVASRFRGSVSNINLTPFRILASIAASVYMRALLGIRSTDPMGGFVGYNARDLRSLDMKISRQADTRSRRRSSTSAGCAASLSARYRSSSGRAARATRRSRGAICSRRSYSRGRSSSLNVGRRQFSSSR
jgi:dolichol-phosphate mannosyltransferase